MEVASVENLYLKYKRGRVRAPKFPEKAEWLGGVPVDLGKLKGRVVLLDFWTFCCINCIHVLEDLKYLEKKYEGKLQVIGVHSPKFDYEKNSDAIMHAAARHNITHPIVNDREKIVWDGFAVSAWPTFVLIDPEGYAFGMLSGEGNREILDRMIEDTIACFEAGFAWPESSLRTEYRVSKGELLYPSKITAGPKGEIAVSETGKNRIIIYDRDLNPLRIIGSGSAGLRDGGFENSQFRSPRGLTFLGHKLFVADTENHVIRLCDLNAETVTTVAGNGVKEYNPIAHGDGLSISLNSPWDVEVVKDNLYIAMAGNHQIWLYNMPTGVIYSLIGTGGENIRDGYFENAVLAQPSALAYDGDGRLYFLDSETSALRCAFLDEERVETIIGEGLFSYGQDTGKLKDSALQHPLGLALQQDKVYIADSYNDRVLSVDMQAGVTELLAEGFSEPSGLAIYNNFIFIADTNNGRVVKLNLTKALS
jgi:thiol-disulfide isomerase/thioredoxin